MNDGGQAYPNSVSADNSGGLNHGKPGMSLRDWFAGQALTGYLSGDIRHDHSDSPAEDVAKSAYRYADAMLKAREPRQE